MKQKLCSCLIIVMLLILFWTCFCKSDFKQNRDLMSTPSKFKVSAPGCTYQANRSECTYRKPKEYMVMGAPGGIYKSNRDENMVSQIDYLSVGRGLNMSNTFGNANAVSLISEMEKSNANNIYVN